MEAHSPRSLASTAIATIAAWLTCSVVLLALNNIALKGRDFFCISLD
jgi:hypothetical protein